MTSKKPPLVERLTSIEGADAASLGVTAVPQPASPAAQVDGSQHLVPGADFADRLPTESLPWFTSLAFHGPGGNSAHASGETNMADWPEGREAEAD